MIDEKTTHTGIIKLDFEHQQILSTLEKLKEATISKSHRILICERLLFYVNEHVKDEEVEMILYNYPDMEEHIVSHAEMQRVFLKALTSFIRDKTSTDDIYTLFTDHILEYDIPMAKFLRDKK